MSILAPKKQCSKCGEWKTLDNFRVRTQRKWTFVASQCKQCESDQARKWRKDNPEKVKERKRKWASEHRETESARALAWRKDNPDKDKAIAKKWRDSHKELAYERSKAWGDRNREKLNAQARARNAAHPERKLLRMLWENIRRARKKGNGGVVTSQEWEELKRKYNYTCLCCGRGEPEIKLTLDHVKPIALGGKNVIENAQPLCQSCNSSKGAREIDYR